MLESGPIRVRYETEAAAWSRFPVFLQAVVGSPKVTSVCEVGGGARPALPLDAVREAGVAYTVMDVSGEELAKAPEGYEKVQADLTAPGFSTPKRYDLVFSKMVVEHVQAPEQFHRNVFGMLSPGGRAFHFFPTLYSPPILVNHLLPERLSEAILHRVQPGMRDAAGDHGKFPPFYRWCRGPTRAQLRRFESVGFEVEEYVGYFGHVYYRRLPPLQRLSDRIAERLVRHPVPALTTYAQVVLRRPAG